LVGAAARGEGNEAGGNASRCYEDEDEGGQARHHQHHQSSYVASSYHVLTQAEPEAVKEASTLHLGLRGGINHRRGGGLSRRPPPGRTHPPGRKARAHAESMRDGGSQ